MSTWLKFNDDATGMDYYYNPTTNETVWERPEDFVESLTESNAWVTFFDDDAQKYYYYNSITEETSWEMPPELQNSSLENEPVEENNPQYVSGDIPNDSVDVSNTENSKLSAEPQLEESETQEASTVPEITVSSNSPNPFGDDDEDNHVVAEPAPVTPAPVLPTPAKAMSIAPASVRMSVVMHNKATERGASAGPRAEAPIAYGTIAKPPPTSSVSSSNISSNKTSTSSNPFGDDDSDVSVSKPTSNTTVKPTKMVIPKPPLTSSSSTGSAPLIKSSSASKNPFGDDDSAANKGTYARPPGGGNPFGPPDHPPSSSGSSAASGGGGKFMQTVKKGSPLLAGPVPPPPPTATAVTAVPVRGARGSLSPSQLLAANGGTSSSAPENVAVMSNNMKLLVKIGVKPAVADSALRDNGNNWVASLQSINQQLVIAIRADPYNTQLTMWGSRISVRIKSWLPNIMEPNKPDFHTGYVCVVNYSSIYNNKNIHPWQLILRYNAFYKLYCVVCKHLKYTNIKAEFPVATSGQWMFGITDEIRNERMNKFDTWMRELLVNPILMTTKEIIDAVNSLLEIDQRITE